jgi:sialate O-acetylesterase
MKMISAAATLCLTFSTLACLSEVRLPHVISDHAVLQRGAPIHLWGWSTPGSHLKAHFHDQTVPAETNAIGTWSLYLDPEAAGGPFTLTISGDGADTKVEDLLVGDVWFASGQSNMEFPLNGFVGSAILKNGPQEIAGATNPKLRLLLVDHKVSAFPLGDSTAAWTTCTPETAAEFSAVAYFFGREIAAKEDVPIGLIDSAWGGTPADSWISLDTLGTNAQLLPAFAARAHFARNLANADLEIADERRQTDAAKAAGKPAPEFPWHPSEESWLPSGIYNGMVAPFTPYSLKGFLWYQGESNSGHDRARFYRTLFPALIEDWRMHFAQGSLPFLFVQISSFNSPGEDWGAVRDAQRRTLSVAKTAMAVTLDVGERDNVHPPDKQTVGARLALAARGMVYGQPVAYRSPLFRQVTTQIQNDGSTALRVWFDNAEKLNARGKPVTGFELAGEDRHYVPADSRLEGTTVVVSAPNLPHPVYVRYGWKGYFDTNLFNAAGLPASTFTSDDAPTW